VTENEMSSKDSEAKKLILVLAITLTEQHTVEDMQFLDSYRVGRL
jgi:hypothetical protein